MAQHNFLQHQVMNHSANPSLIPDRAECMEKEACVLLQAQVVHEKEGRSSTPGLGDALGGACVPLLAQGLLSVGQLIPVSPGSDTPHGFCM